MIFSLHPGSGREGLRNKNFLNCEIMVWINDIFFLHQTCFSFLYCQLSLIFFIFLDTFRSRWMRCSKSWMPTKMCEYTWELFLCMFEWISVKQWQQNLFRLDSKIVFFLIFRIGPNHWENIIIQNNCLPAYNVLDNKNSYRNLISSVKVLNSLKMQAKKKFQPRANSNITGNIWYLF